MLYSAGGLYVDRTYSVAQKLPETDSLPFNTDSLEKEVDAFCQCSIH